MTVVLRLFTPIPTFNMFLKNAAHNIRVLNTENCEPTYRRFNKENKITRPTIHNDSNDTRAEVEKNVGTS